MPLIDASKNLDGYFQEFEKIENCGFFSVDKDIQKYNVSLLNGAIKSLKDLSDSFLEDKNISRANECLEARMYAYALRFRINAYILLKNHKPHNAYDEIIDGQRACEKAIYAGFDETKFQKQLDILLGMETILFPRQIWQSIGFTAERVMCSICDKEAHLCEHRYGKPYFGKLCYYKYDGLTIDHGAVIIDSQPENKKCRITQYASEGTYFDRITKKPVKYIKGDDGIFKARLMVIKELEY